MSHQTTITDFPYIPKDQQTLELRYTQNGKAVVNVRIPMRNRVKDDQTGQWVDETEPIWVDVPFWEQEAERIVNTVRNGDRITVQGTLVKRQYQKQDGSEGESFELRRARFLGVIPGGQTQGGGQLNGQQAQGGWPQPQQPTPQAPQSPYGAPHGGGQGDPWGQAQPPF